MGRKGKDELPSFTARAFEVMVPKMEERGPLFNNSMLDRLIPVDQVGNLNHAPVVQRDLHNSS